METVSTYMSRFLLQMAEDLLGREKYPDQPLNSTFDSAYSA